LDYQNNYVGNSSKKFSSNQLERPNNYFDRPTKLFSELYLAKFLGTSVKSLFPYKTP